MKLILRLVLSLIALCVAGFTLSSHSNATLALRSVRQAKSITTEPVTIVEVSDNVILSDTKRFGINIGSHSPYGSAQILKNLVPNPGFEAAEYATIIHAKPGSDGGRVQADNWEPAWNNDGLLRGYPQGFWNGAAYEIVSGAAKGRSGTVSVFTHDDNANTFYLETVGAAPQKDDAVLLRTTVGGYELDIGPNHRADSAETRPNSPGSQSLRLLPPAEQWQPSWSQPFDTYFRDQDRGGSKFLIADGNWRFAVWARATQPGDSLRIVFQRFGERIFFDETVNLSDQWTLIERSFSIPAGADPLENWQPEMARNGLSLELHLPAGSADVLVDDISFSRSGQNNPTEFSDKFVSYLEELQPGILRNWGAQLGSSLDNQLAEPHGRKLTGHNPKYRVARNFHYSLHDFLVLSQIVGAEPWYVIPPTFSQNDLTNLVAYLSAPAGSHPYADLRAQRGQPVPWTDIFPTVHLEFGNEVWGDNGGLDPFLGATLRGGTRAGQVANDRFGLMKASGFYSAEKINLIIGGQAAFPDRQGELERASSNHDSIGIAPYFAKSLDFNGDNTALFQSLYAHAQQSVSDSVVTQGMGQIGSSGRGTSTAVYEINLHTLTGNMDLNHRNVFVSGQAASLALPLTMMTYQEKLGIRDLVPYQALQFSTLMPDRYYARIFGLLRDLEATGRKRPTWLATELANRAIRRDMLATTQAGANPSFTAQPGNGIATAQTVSSVQSFAYRDGNSYGLALYNLDINAAQGIELKLPSAAIQANAQIHRLEADSVYDTNEDWPKVDLTTEQVGNFSNGYRFVIEPHSMVVVEWIGDGNSANAAPAPVAQPPVTEQQDVVPPPVNLIEQEPIVANADQFSMAGFNMSANVLENDVFALGFLQRVISAEIMQKPQYGAIWMDTNGQFTYTPNIGYSGPDSFTYRVMVDDWTSTEISVSLNVRPR